MADAVSTAGSRDATDEEKRAFMEKVRSLSFQAKPQQRQAKTDEHGNTVTEHKDGRVDVQINVTEPVKLQPTEA